MRILVTGGTGLLGNTLIRQLLAKNIEVVASLRRQPESPAFRGLDVSVITGDLADHAGTLQVDTAPAWLCNAVASCDAVVHCAAHIHIGWRQMDQSMAVNALGTRRVAEACRLHGKRMVHVGTVNTLAVGQASKPADEDTIVDRDNQQVPCAYTVSKRESVHQVTSAVSRGLNAVIIHPGFMLGPWDWKPSSGQMIVELAKRWTPLAPSGGCSLCDSRDVAAGIIQAVSADVESGRTYIMGGHNISYWQLWSEINARLAKRPPLGVAPGWLQSLTRRISDAVTLISGHERTLNGASVQMSSQFHWYDSYRARTELGYSIRPAEETLDEAITWLGKHYLS